MPRTIIVSLLVLTVLGCQHTAAPTARMEPVIDEAPLSVEEQGLILRLEDRREFDAAIAESWIASPSFYHRARMALALGRIGFATFVDANGNGSRDEGERMAGVDLLASLQSDPNPIVRLSAAFALGEIGDPAGVAALLFMASNDDHAGVRSEAIEALSKLSAHVELNDYLQFTSSSHPVGVQSTALRYLFRFDGDEALANARAHLGSSSIDVRRAATYTLNRRGYDSATLNLTALLDDQDVLTRSYAARALDRIASPQSLDPLLEAVLDIHPWVRTNALRGIATIAGQHTFEFEKWATYEKLVPILTAADDPDPGTRATAIETLGVFAPRLEAAREKLIAIAAQEEPAFRESAVQALARAFGNDDALIRALLETDNRWIRIIILRETSAASAGPSLRARYASDPDASVRSAAIAAIPDLNVEIEKALVLRALDDPDPVVRASAIERAGKLSGEELVRIATEQEMRARADEINDARIAALSLMLYATGSGAQTALRGLLRDRDPVIRRLAAEALESLGFPRPQYTPLDTGGTDDWYADVAAWAEQPHNAVIETVRGPIEINLLTEDAPITTKNFVDLAKAGYFDGTSFMRVVPNFVIQGGDPRNDMTGGPGYAIRDEINLQEYTRGAVGMALSGPDTGGSQFFITHSPQHHLDGGYTIFGRVTDGMTDTVDQMRRGDEVTTIRIDAAIATAEDDVTSSARFPLPLEIGPITPERALTAIPEYHERKDAYTPDETVIAMMAPMITGEDRIEVFMGTWCEDSQREVPRFYKILDQLEENHGTTIPVAYVAVDRSKQRPADLVEGRSIDLVATFIVYRGDEEIGRIVEAPVSLLEDDLLAIFAGATR